VGGYTFGGFFLFMLFCAFVPAFTHSCWRTCSIQIHNTFWPHGRTCCASEPHANHFFPACILPLVSFRHVTAWRKRRTILFSVEDSCMSGWCTFLCTLILFSSASGSLSLLHLLHLLLYVTCLSPVTVYSSFDEPFLKHSLLPFSDGFFCLLSRYMYFLCAFYYSVQNSRA